VSAFAAAAPAHAATGIITTVAGTPGSAGFSGDDALATAAQLYNPWGIAVDSDGNLYIADNLNNRIRKVTAGGIITTVAGGSAGFSGDDGPATAAQLDEPSDVAVDAAGNLYIADYNNDRIRKVTAATGIITTIAGNGNSGSTGDGNQATLAEIGGPESVSLDSAGNLYIAEYRNNRIRKVTTGGIITTVAGSSSQGNTGDGALATAATLNSPLDAIVDSAGNIYINDYRNNRIRKVAAGTGIITAFAGTGANGFSGDGLDAVDAEFGGDIGYLALDGDGNLYIPDYNNHRIRKVTASTGIITTVAGTGVSATTDGPVATAELNGPWAVETSSTGDLFIAEYDGDTIRKVSGIAAPFITLPPTGANTNGLVWLAAALLGAGAVLVTTRRRHTV